MNRLARLLAPQSVAVVGGRPAERAVEQCRRLGFEGDLWAVHPTRSDLAGVRCVPTVDDLPGVPDAVLVAVNRRATVEVVDRLAAMGAGTAVCYASGFAEAGSEGEALQGALNEAAGSMPIIGPNCYGTVSAVAGAALWPDQQGLHRVESGVALVTQSGNIGLDLSLQTRPMSIAHLLTLGNQADVGIEECLEALISDPTVTAVGLHVEALHDAARFSTACARASRLGKPVVVLKTGVSDRGAEIAASHTSSIVGSDAAYGALFDRLAVRRVRSIPELLDALHVLDGLGGLSGRRIVSLSCSGGEASIVADRCDELGLDLPSFGAERIDGIRTALGEPDKASLVSVSNPFDYHTFIWDDRDRLTATFTEAIRPGEDLSGDEVRSDGILEGEGPDAAVLVLDFPGAGLDDTSWWPTLEAFGEAAAITGTNGVVAASMAENLPQAVEAAASDLGLIPVRGIDEALRALDAAAWWGRRSTIDAPCPVEPVSGAARILAESEAKAWLEEVGLSVPDRAVVSISEAPYIATEIGFPVVLKAVGPAHKTEVGGVALGLSDRDAVADAAEQVAGASHGDLVMVEAQVEGVLAEILVSVRREAPVGWLLTVGVGGTLVEMFRDTVCLLLPVTGDEVLGMLHRLATWPLLAGHSGQPGADLESVVDAVLAVARVAIEIDGLVEVEINPLLATSDGATVVDALMTCAAD